MKIDLKLSFAAFLRVFRLGVWALVLAAGGVACGGSSESENTVSDNSIVAVVNGKKVPVQMIRTEMEAQKRKFRLNKKSKIRPQELLWLKTQALNQVIQTTLFRQKAMEQGIVVTREEFEKALQETQSGYQEETFRKHLEMEGISPSEWKKRLKNNLLINKLIDREVNSKVKVTEEEIIEYFKNHEEEFHKGERVRALHIMVETEDEARQILKELLTKGRDFSELAKQYSLGPEGTDGGDLGYVQSGQMPAELEEVFKLKVNEVSNIIRTPYGSHIFKVVDKQKDRKMSLEESRKIIHDKLLRQRQEETFKVWLGQLKASSQIKVNDAVLQELE